MAYEVKYPELFGREWENEWEEWFAPVVPPTWVQEYVRRTGDYMDWNNYQVYTDEEKKEIWHYPIFYRTRLLNGKIVTNVFPGSYKPVNGWLYK